MNLGVTGEYLSSTPPLTFRPRGAPASCRSQAIETEFIEHWKLFWGWWWPVLLLHWVAKDKLGFPLEVLKILHLLTPPKNIIIIIIYIYFYHTVWNTPIISHVSYMLYPTHPKGEEQAMWICETLEAHLPVSTNWSCAALLVVGTEKPVGRNNSTKCSHRRGSSLVPNACKKNTILFIFFLVYYLPGEPTDKISWEKCHFQRYQKKKLIMN